MYSQLAEALKEFQGFETLEIAINLFLRLKLKKDFYFLLQKL